MPTVNSVLGPLDIEDLGFTLMHEHIITASAGVTQNYPELLGANFMDRIVHGLTNAKKGGIDTIVDATTLDLGRDVTVLANVSRQTGINIIACTGWWCEAPFFFTNVSCEQLTKLFVREIMIGIAGTDIKAGIIKAASDAPGVTEWQETILRAAARAHLQTDVPIMLHSYSPGRIGEQQLAILKEEGVDPQRVKMDHSNDSTDMEYLTWLLEQGCYLGMDRYPGRGDASPIDRTKILKALIDAGYTDRLLLSHDYPLVQIIEESPAGTRPRKEREGLNPHGYMYIKKIVFPSLQEMGVPDSILSRLCTVGPRNFFNS